MGEIIATTGPQLMAGDNSGVYSDYEGTLMLAPTRNLIPDPKFEMFDPKDGSLNYWWLRSSTAPTHWVPFVRDNNVQKRFSKQIAGAIPLETTMIDLKDELLPGASPLDMTLTENIAAPAKPVVSTYPVSGSVGFPAGWYSIAVGYILNEAWETGTRLTGPGEPSEPFQLAQGQGIMLISPTEIAADVYGLIFYLTKPQLTADAVYQATEYFGQKRFPTRGIPRRLQLYGPYDIREQSTGNKTYIGAKTGLATLEVTRRKSDVGYVPVTETDDNGNEVVVPPTTGTVQLSYRIITAQGSSQSKDPSGAINVVNNGEQMLSFRPKSLPANAIGWAPEVIMYNVWHEIFKGDASYFQAGEFANVYSSIAGDWPDSSGTNISETGGPAKEDTTGMPAPTDPMEVPIIMDLDTSGLTPGIHYVKNALLVGDSEGPASEFTSIDVPPGHALKIQRPMLLNKMENSDVGERSRAAFNNPRAWEIPAVAGVEQDTSTQNVIAVRDTSSDTTTKPVATSPVVQVTSERDEYTITLDAVVRGISNTIRGAVRVQLQEYDSSGTLIQTQSIQTITSSLAGLRQRIVQRVTRNQSAIRSPRLRIISPNCTSLRVALLSVPPGSGAGVYIEVVMRWLACFLGHLFPKPKPPDPPPPTDGGGGGGGTDPNPPPDPPPPPPPSWDAPDDVLIEQTQFVYPNGGYCSVQLNPTDGPYKANYTTLNETDFAGANLNGWTTNTTGFTRNEVSAESAMYTDNGLLFQKYGGGVGNTYTLYTIADRSAVSLSADFYYEASNVSSFRLLELRDSSDASIAYVSIENGTLTIFYRGTDNTMQSVATSITGITEGQFFSVELSVNKSTGSLEVFYGIDESSRYLVHTLSNLTFGTSGPLNRLFIWPGDTASQDASRYTMHVGKILLSDIPSTSNRTLETGNYIEYFAPDNTPLDATYGPTGLRVPAKGARDYSFGVNVWYQDMVSGSELFRVRAMDANDRTLQVYDAIVQGMVGDKEKWERHTKTIHTPPGTSYIEFFANNLGGGKLRIHGLQMENGTVPTAFNTDRVRSGWFNVFLRNRQPGLRDNDLMIELGRVKKLINILTDATDDDYTSYMTRYRSGNTLGEVDAATYINDFYNLDMSKTITEVRVDLSSTVDGETPWVRGIHMSLQRPHPQLCREDGTEYAGGVLAYDISTPQEPPNMEVLEMASGGQTEVTWGTRRKRTIDFKIEAYRKSTAEEIMYNRYHTLETPEKTYKIVTEAIKFTPLPGSRVYYNDGGEFFQREVADITARIISEHTR